MGVDLGCGEGVGWCWGGRGGRDVRFKWEGAARGERVVVLWV